jgi:hypothetical protein
MGGYGSGRWNIHTKKDTLEDCRCLEANRWMREEMLREGMRHWGGWTWRNAQTGEQTSSIGYEVDTTNMAFPWVRLYYTLTKSQEQIDYRIRLQTTHTSEDSAGGSPARWLSTNAPALAVWASCTCRPAAATSGAGIATI